MSKEENDWPVVVEKEVSWGEMDSLGHVNNTVYLRWFEDARIAYFDAVGMFDRFQSEGIGPILAKTDISFRLPVSYPDRIQVFVRVGHMGNTSMVMEYRVISEAHGGAVAAEGEAVVVMVHYASGQKHALGDTLRHRVHELEKKAVGFKG